MSQIAAMELEHRLAASESRNAVADARIKHLESTINKMIDVILADENTFQSYKKLLDLYNQAELPK